MFVFIMQTTLPTSTLFPHTTLFRSAGDHTAGVVHEVAQQPVFVAGELDRIAIDRDTAGAGVEPDRSAIDRKSTRLNSSHLGISYAVFGLKKKKIGSMQHTTYKNREQ